MKLFDADGANIKANEIESADKNWKKAVDAQLETILLNWYKSEEQDRILVECFFDSILV